MLGEDPVFFQMNIEPKFIQDVETMVCFDGADLDNLVAHRDTGGRDGAIHGRRVLIPFQIQHNKIHIRPPWKPDLHKWDNIYYRRKWAPKSSGRTYMEKTAMHLGTAVFTGNCFDL